MQSLWGKRLHQGLPQLGQPGSTVVVATAFAIAMGFSIMTTPLWALLADELPLTPGQIGIAFSAYSASVAVVLFAVGSLGDAAGSRLPMMLGLWTLVASAVCFLVMDNFVLLVVSRVLAGVGVGFITGTASAYILRRWDPGTRAGRRSSVLVVLANLGGLAIGTSVSGGIYELSGGNFHAPAAVFLCLLVASALAMPAVSERGRHSQPFQFGRITVPKGRVRPYLAAAVLGFVAMGVLALFSSLVPALLLEREGIIGAFAQGVVTGAALAAAALAQIGLSRWGNQVSLSIVGVLVAFGLGLFAACVVGSSSLWPLAFAVVLSGAGAGMALKVAISSVDQISSSSEKGGAVTGVYLSGYTGATVPIVVAAVGADQTPISIWLPALCGAFGILAVLGSSILLYETRSNLS